MDSRPALPGLALSLGMTWLLTGAMYKLFDGAVGDLPKTVLENSPFDPFSTFRYAIAAELAVVGLVIALPRIGWLALAGVFATFLAVLFPLHLEGVESCGCMGGTVKISPMTMMLIDGGLLALILASRPWSQPKGAGLGFLAALVLMGAGIAAPLVKIKPEEAPAKLTQTELDQRRAEAEARIAAAKGAQAGAAVAPVEAPKDTDVTESPIDTDVMTEAAAEAPAEGPAEGPADGSAEDPAADATLSEGDVAPDAGGLPQYMNLNDFQGWVGQEVFALPWYDIADQSMGAVMPGSHVIVYRQQCEYCKEHLIEVSQKMMQGDPEWAGTDVVLLRITEASDTDANNVCQTLPEPHQKVTLPALDRGYLVTTPFAFDVNEEFAVAAVFDVRKEQEATKK